MHITLLIAPEAIVDIGPVEWLRDATVDEANLFTLNHPQLNQIDSCGRPYFCMVVDTDKPGFPKELTKRLMGTLRLRWWNPLF